MCMAMYSQLTGFSHQCHSSLDSIVVAQRLAHTLQTIGAAAQCADIEVGCAKCRTSSATTRKACQVVVVRGTCPYTGGGE